MMTNREIAIDILDKALYFEWNISIEYNTLTLTKTIPVNDLEAFEKADQECRDILNVLPPIGSDTLIGTLKDSHFAHVAIETGTFRVHKDGAENVLKSLEGLTQQEV